MKKKLVMATLCITLSTMALTDAADLISKKETETVATEVETEKQTTAETETETETELTKTVDATKQKQRQRKLQHRMLQRQKQRQRKYSTGRYKGRSRDRVSYGTRCYTCGCDRSRCDTCRIYSTGWNIPLDTAEQ